MQSVEIEYQYAIRYIGTFDAKDQAMLADAVVRRELAATESSTLGAEEIERNVELAEEAACEALLRRNDVEPPSGSASGGRGTSVPPAPPGPPLSRVCCTRLALYPIVLNGGGAGLYRDPREFATDVGGGGFSVNHRTAAARRAHVMSHVRFAWPYETRTDRRDAAADIEIGAGRPTPADDGDDDVTYRTRRSLGTLASAMNPWKVWESVRGEMSRLAMLRTQCIEDEASHVTLARQRNKASRVSSV